MDILKKSLAPLTEEAWEEIEDQAKLTLKGNLSARRVVDFNGPHGWEFGAVSTGCCLGIPIQNRMICI